VVNLIGCFLRRIEQFTPNRLVVLPDWPDWCGRRGTNIYMTLTPKNDQFRQLRGLDTPVMPLTERDTVSGPVLHKTTSAAIQKVTRKNPNAYDRATAPSKRAGSVFDPLRHGNQRAEFSHPVLVADHDE